jgi:hypothetical protein
MARSSDYRAVFHLRKGGLHKALGIAEGKPIPEEKKEEAANSSNPHMQKMGQFALNASHWSHKK